MDTIDVLNATGHLSLMWNPDDTEDCQRAREEIKRLQSAGYQFFLVDDQPADAVSAGHGSLIVKRIEQPIETLAPLPSQDAEREETTPAEVGRRGRRAVATRPMSGGSDDLLKENIALRDALRPFVRIFQIAVVGDLDEKVIKRFKGRGIFSGRTAPLTIGHFRQAARVVRWGAKPITEDEAHVSDEEMARGLSEDWTDALKGLDLTTGEPCPWERAYAAAVAKARVSAIGVEIDTYADMED